MTDRKISWDVAHSVAAAGATTTATAAATATGEKKEEQRSNHTNDKNATASSPNHKKRHGRNISWGGTTIEFPKAFEHEEEYHPAGDHGGSVTSSPVVVLSSDTLFHDYRPKDDGIMTMDEQERSKVAAEAVQATEAALYSKSPTQRNLLPSISSRRLLHTADDLSKMLHPIESEAEAHILKALELQEQQQQQQQQQQTASTGTGDSQQATTTTTTSPRLQPVQDEEALASLFTPVQESLLGNVPEGAEGIFHRQPSMTLSSETGGEGTAAERSQPSTTDESLTNNTTTSNYYTGHRQKLSRGFDQTNCPRQNSAQNSDVLFCIDTQSRWQLFWVSQDSNQL